MLRVFANDNNFAMAFDHFAFFTDGFDGWSNFHIRSSFFYLYRNVIRPRVKSYGDISTVTLSPGKMRM